MSNNRMRYGSLYVIVGFLTMTLSGGCTHGNGATYENFVTDLLRSAAAALLL